MKITTAIARYLLHLKARGRAYHTLKGAKYDLRYFARFIQAAHCTCIEDITAEIIEQYHQELVFYLTAKSKPLSLRTRSQRMSVVKGFTRFLKEKEYLTADPGHAIQLPKKPRPLPKVILTAKEITRLFNAPDMRTHTGYRNRIVLQILYDTGLRRAEMAALRLADLDLEGGYVHVRSGKGDKDRVVPVSAATSHLTYTYMVSVRPFFIRSDDPGHLILNRWGAKMTPDGIWQIVKRCGRLSGIKKNITTHSLRHSCATHMLRNGAPIRHIQELLGHESLESTQIYTRVTINDLKQIHAKYHPGNKLTQR